jgi:hypothetical protein
MKNFESDQFNVPQVRNEELGRFSYFNFDTNAPSLRHRNENMTGNNSPCRFAASTKRTGASLLAKAPSVRHFAD